jgi:hypothetical protein
MCRGQGRDEIHVPPRLEIAVGQEQHSRLRTMDTGMSRIFPPHGYVKFMSVHSERSGDLQTTPCAAHTHASLVQECSRDAILDWTFSAQGPEL